MRTKTLSIFSTGLSISRSTDHSAVLRCGVFLGLAGLAAIAGDARAASCSVPSLKHLTIQGAANDKTCTEIVLSKHTYTEQVTLNRPDGIAIHGVGAGRTILASPALRLRSGVSTSFLPKYAFVVQVKPGTSATLTDLTIDGGGNAKCGIPYFGVRVVGATAELDRVVVQNVLGQGASFACANVIGVAVTADAGSPPETASLTLNDSTVRSFQQIGILANGPNASLTLQNTVLHGAGSESSLPQVGIQISAGAAGTLNRTTVTNVQFSGDPCTGVGTAVSFSGAGGVSTLSDSVINDVDRGVYLTENSGQVTVSKSRFMNTLGGILSTNNGTGATPIVTLSNNGFATTSRSTAATVATCFNDSGDAIAVGNEKSTVVSGNSAADSARCAVELLAGSASLTVNQNQAVRSTLVDIQDEGSGNNLSKNLCQTSMPAGLCSGPP
jgi:hypothetical protein